MHSILYSSKLGTLSLSDTNHCVIIAVFDLLKAHDSIRDLSS